MNTLFSVFAVSSYVHELASLQAASLVSLPPWIVWLAPLFVLWLGVWLTVRYIPNHQVGVVEKLWSFAGSVPEGRILALDGEAGYQAALLRGGLHFGLWRWQYRIHRCPLVSIPQSKIGYVYARDGEPLPAGQTLAREIECNHFQDAVCFLGDANDPETPRGQRGRQRRILREGVYAINPALFIVIAEDMVYTLRRQQGRELKLISDWQHELRELDGFDPVIIGSPLPQAEEASEHLTTVDSIGIVTVHDGPSLEAGEIIAPMCGADATEPNYHNNYQNAEAFLRAGGRRGRQYLPLTDGTYFINRWFATIEAIPKTVVPIGYVGVVISYYGRTGKDVSGVSFRHGERVAEGERGVWAKPLGPGKYPFNTYAGCIVHVPTTNFVLHWITGKSESHRFDESLRSIDLVTRDAYEPSLPLSVVVHFDYQKAPTVIQRFGDVKKLITQTLDPMLSAFFRDVAHTKTMLELLHQRDSIQTEAREELRRKFLEFDIECVDVLIGKPDTDSGNIETLLDQLRQRQLSTEQLETYEKQRAAAEKLQRLAEAQAHANMQTALTNSRVQVQISESQGEADLARARRQAEQTIVVAEADLGRARRQAEQTVLLAEADGRQKALLGRGESQRALQVGLAEATVLLRKISSYGDPRLYALSGVAEQLSHSSQPLVPERVFMAGSNGENGHGPTAASSGMLGHLISLLVAEKSGFQMADGVEPAGMKELTDRMLRQAVENIDMSEPTADDNHKLKAVERQ